MAYTHEDKHNGDLIPSANWNAMGHEIVRLERDKLNRGGDTIQGDLSVRGALRPTTGDAEVKGILFADPGGGTSDAAGWIRYYPVAGGGLSLALGASKDPANRVILAPSGNLGIGSPIPTAKLDVNGGALIGGPLSVKGDLTVNGAIRANVIQTTLRTAEGLDDFVLKNSNTWEDVPDLSISFRIGQPTSMLVFYQISMQAGTPGTLFTRLWVDTGEWKTTSRAGAGVPGVRPDYSPSNLQMLDLDPGQHTIKVQYRTQATGTNAPKKDQSHSRTLQVLIFGQTTA
jgi:hypothetical protein